MPLSFPKVIYSYGEAPHLTDAIQQPDHAIKMHELPDEYLADALPIAKKIALAQGLDNYNFLQVCSLSCTFSASPLTCCTLRRTTDG